MKLRWFIENNGRKTLQYENEIGWYDVSVVFESDIEKLELKIRIIELEDDYRALIEARK